MVSQNKTMHNIDSLPPSDFKDLLLLLQEHEASFNNFLKSIKNYTTLFARQDLDIVRNLKQQSNNIDAHYGWALASDSALVARMLRSDEEEEAQSWMRRMFREYEERKQQLNKLVKGV
jgi:pantothenate kinase-related protein Tda10